MSLPTNGGTDRDAFGSASALAAHPFPTASRPLPPSYSISRSEIITSPSTHALSRKRSHSGDSLHAGPPRVALARPHRSLPGPVSYLNSATVPTGNNAVSLRCVLPAPPKPKRLRREPRSPTSVGEVSDAKTIPAARTATPAAVTPGAAQMQSMLRGLQHLSACGASGCANPLCVSTRAFVEKVKAHRESMAGKANHDAAMCGACKLWANIVRVHAPACCAGATCCVPGCFPQQSVQRNWSG